MYADDLNKASTTRLQQRAWIVDSIKHIPMTQALANVSLHHITKPFLYESHASGSIGAEEDGFTANLT